MKNILTTVKTSIFLALFTIFSLNANAESFCARDEGAGNLIIDESSPTCTDDIMCLDMGYDTCTVKSDTGENEALKANDINKSIKESQEFIFKESDFTLNKDVSIISILLNPTTPQKGSLYIDENNNSIIDSNEVVTYPSGNLLNAIKASKLKYKSTKDIKTNESDSFGMSISEGSAIIGLSVNITINAVNKTPTISGTPSTNAIVGKEYYFMPIAKDDDNNTLSFSIDNKPSWLDFNTSTGVLKGTPKNEDIKLYEDISIKVADYNSSASLQSFDINVSELIVRHLDENNSYAWNDKIGWINLQNMKILPDHMEGYIWSNIIGWIKLGSENQEKVSHKYLNTTSENWGVNIEKDGKLNGYAWNDKIGWIDFNSSKSQVRIDPSSGEFSGYAWNNKITWISFKGNHFKVKLSSSLFSPKSIEIKKGWSLISLPVDTNINYSELNSKLVNSITIWKYKNDWEAYGKGEIQNKLDQENIKKLTSIGKYEGFWVNSQKADKLEVSGAEYSILNSSELNTTNSGWYLLGTGLDVNTSDIFNKNDNINILWVFDNNWSASSPNQTIQSKLDDANISKINEINKAKGFWINIK